MKNEWLRLRRSLVVVVVAGVLHLALAHHLAHADTVKALAETMDLGVLAALVILLVARLFLLFVAPGWLLYRAVAIVLSRRPSLRRAPKK